MMLIDVNSEYLSFQRWLDPNKPFKKQLKGK